jgi:8-oxo-dGTP pyrophosphatase MutT (NUDIX family)
MSLPFLLVRTLGFGQIMSERISVTVAAVVERDGRFLLVEEHADGGLKLNQPAGHLEPGESLLQAVVRETLEETAYRFTARALLGVYRWRHPEHAVTFVRFAFLGSVDGPERGRVLDEGIVQAVWLTPEALHAQRGRHRSPLVVRCVEDCLAGKRYPLDLLVDEAGAGA